MKADELVGDDIPSTTTQSIASTSSRPTPVKRTRPLTPPPSDSSSESSSSDSSDSKPETQVPGMGMPTQADMMAFMLMITKVSYQSSDACISVELMNFSNKLSQKRR